MLNYFGENHHVVRPARNWIELYVALEKFQAVPGAHYRLDVLGHVHAAPARVCVNLRGQRKQRPISTTDIQNAGFPSPESRIPSPGILLHPLRDLRPIAHLRRAVSRAVVAVQAIGFSDGVLDLGQSCSEWLQILRGGGTRKRQHQSRDLEGAINRNFHLGSNHVNASRILAYMLYLDMPRRCRHGAPHSMAPRFVFNVFRLHYSFPLNQLS